MTSDWFEREEQLQPSGRVLIRLRCLDCGGEVRLAKGGGGEQRAARMVAEHKPSGCCADRQEANARAAAREAAA